jgi:hypothetical protein
MTAVRVDPDAAGMQARVRIGADPDRRGWLPAAVLKHEHNVIAGRQNRSR